DQLPLGEIGDHDLRLTTALADLDLYLLAPHTRLHRYAEPLAALAQAIDPAVDRGKICSFHMLAAVDDRLWRVDAAAAECACIAILPLRVFLGGERVGPAEIIPVVDVIGERDNIVLIDNVLQHGIGRRAGSTALRGEQLDDALRRRSI